METELRQVLQSIEREFEAEIEKGARNYLEVNIGRQAEKLGFTALQGDIQNSHVIVPLKEPQRGMKVRIDGRTFVGYKECLSGIAVPGHVARKADHCLNPYVPNDSMICNFA